ncbi:MAG: hypothetical protein LBT40_04170, partial [Deltaproteobacteria bacterium]|nr:hypothetical protein [Deltaproteobacteria bacterium]
AVQSPEVGLPGPGGKPSCTSNDEALGPAVGSPALSVNRYNFCNCSGDPLLRGFMKKESPDEDPFKFKSQQWILHLKWKSFSRGHLVGKAPLLSSSWGGI